MIAFPSKLIATIALKDCLKLLRWALTVGDSSFSNPISSWVLCTNVLSTSLLTDRRPALQDSENCVKASETGSDYVRHFDGVSKAKQSKKEEQKPWGNNELAETMAGQSVEAVPELELTAKLVKPQRPRRWLISI